MLVVPLLAGAVCGFLLSETETGWWIANGVALLGGIAGGFEHETARSGAGRGLLAGAMFGTGVFIADAVSAAPPAAQTPEPIILFPLLAAGAGLLLGALGGRIRARTAASG